jgi:hypothetical protein
METMVNKPKAKGTGNENRIRKLLEEVWPEADRSAAGTPARDFSGTGNVSVEAKKRKRWDVQDWARQQEARGHYPWAVFMAPGDGRLASAPPGVMMVPEEFGIELLKAAKFLGVIQ